MTDMPPEAVPQDPESHLWDVIVVGAGAGGATAGFNLAASGRSVLFVERGKLLHRDPATLAGIPFAWTSDSEKALNHGWWPRSVYYREEENGASVAAGPPIGAGAGGSTAQFNAVMDRFRPQDFTPRCFFPDVPGASLPDAWPISYEEMAPFYERAERLFRVRGTQDPLAPFGASLLEPPAATARELAVSDALRSAGLNPYRIHYALEQLPGCSGCSGMVCPRACRNDAARICLYPALDRYGAKILSNCRAIRFEESHRTVERVICEWNSRPIALRARIFILAANAFLTPALLQRSANERFPNGLANSSGLVGRNLMLHVSDLFLLTLKRTSRAFGYNINHGVSLNDFYVHNGTKLGNVHAHPMVTRTEAIAIMRLYKRPFNRLPAALLSAIAAAGSVAYRASIPFATIVEDLPYPGNCVTAKPGSEEDIIYTYRYPDELRHRARMLYESFKNAVSSHFDVRPVLTAGGLNRGHVCGTCRFGDDPRTSVLDRDNRAHDLDNLYILDGSFFPSSGGINPSLTIVANSLRATDKIAQRL
ncbi:MAG: GMC family oxidoreductase [Candidatus Binataceae bacterium]|jgi:choline dehydrogenase-like flavoprotein